MLIGGTVFTGMIMKSKAPFAAIIRPMSPHPRKGKQFLAVEHEWSISELELNHCAQEIDVIALQLSADATDKL